MSIAFAQAPAEGDDWVPRFDDCFQAVDTRHDVTCQ